MKTAAAALGSKGHHPNAISISLGGCEPELNLELAARRALGNVFAVAAGAGISTLVAAGDQGSSACRVETPYGETALPLLAVSDPASSPFVTAVGGTNVSLNAKNRIHAEVTWNDSPAFFGGGGGGVSLFSPQRPWWQSNPKLANTAPAASSPTSPASLTSSRATPSTARRRRAPNSSSRTRAGWRSAAPVPRRR